MKIDVRRSLVDASVLHIPDPFAFDLHDFLLSPSVSDFKWSDAIGFRPAELLDDVRPAATPDTGILVLVYDSEEIRFALNKPTGKPCTEKISSDFNAIVS